MEGKFIGDFPKVDKRGDKELIEELGMIQEGSIWRKVYCSITTKTTNTYFAEYMVSLMIYGIFIFCLLGLTGIFNLNEMFQGVKEVSGLYDERLVTFIINLGILSTILYTILYVYELVRKGMGLKASLLMIFVCPFTLPTRIMYRRKEYLKLENELEHKLKVVSMFKDTVYNQELDKLRKGMSDIDIEYHLDTLKMDIVGIDGSKKKVYLNSILHSDSLKPLGKATYLDIVNFVYNSVLDDMNKVVELENGYTTRKYNLLTSKEDGLYYSANFKELYKDNSRRYGLVDCRSLTKGMFKEVMDMLEENKESIVEYTLLKEYEDKLKEEEDRRSEEFKRILESRKDYLKKEEEVRGKLLTHNLKDSWKERELESLKDGMEREDYVVTLDSK